ncbi:MAG: ABC transporter ATP-binding protein [Ilumatobacteraceae bacterium]|jgi:ABC-2 type transport system ATP-binding protein
MSTPAIRVESLWKNFRLYHERNRYIKAAMLRGRRARYEEFWALQDVNLTVEKGATVGVIGSNGSGKTTLLKCLTGIYTPERGSISVEGNLAALLELGAGFHPELSGTENIYLNGSIMGMSKKEIDNKFDSIVEFAGLEQFIDTPVKNFSSGMTVRLGFSIATHVEPEVLLIDEILSVGDQAFQRKSTEKIEQFRRDGRTILVVSHSLGLVQQLCDTVVWLEKGHVKMIGPAAEVIAEYTGNTYGNFARDDASSKTRWGSGDAQITQVTMLDTNDQPVDTLSSGAELRIRLELNSHIRIESPVLRVQLETMSGELVWSTSTQRGTATLRVLDGPATAVLHLPSLPLAEGTYYLSVSITDATGATEFDHCQHWAKIHITGGQPNDGGVVALPSTWSIGRQRT